MKALSIVRAISFVFGANRITLHTMEMGKHYCQEVFIQTIIKMRVRISGLIIKMIGNLWGQFVMFPNPPNV